MPVNVLYRTSARATGGRDGHSATLDGAVDVKLTTPKELGGAGETGVNPEQLFATGYAACFLGAMKFVALKEGDPKISAGTTVTSTVGIARSFAFTRNSPVLTDAAFVPASAKDSAQISQLIGVASDLSVRSMGDKSPKSKNKQATQKQTKAEVESQKKKDAASAKQSVKTKK